MTKLRHPRVASTLGRPQIEARQPEPVDPVTAPVSLPLQEATQAENASTSYRIKRYKKIPPKSKSLPPEPGAALEPFKPPQRIHDQANSKVRSTAVKIVFLESTGMERPEIAKALGISPRTIPGYLYKAGKMGWLDFDDPKDQLEYRLMNKVVRNLEESLDSDNVLATGQRERTATALKMAEGALYPKLAVTSVAPPSTIVGIKIQMVDGGLTQVREGTIMGANEYVDGTAEVGK